MKCARCGKKFGFFEEKTEWLRTRVGKEYFKKTICKKCYEELWKELEKKMEELEERRKHEPTCDKCVYFEKDVQYGDIGIFTPNYIEVTSDYCKKFGFELFYPFEEAKTCTSFLTPEQYKKKSLKGEMGRKKETHFVVCEYCDTRYDANKHPRCPSCGATNR